VNERIRQLLSQAGVHYEVLPKDTVYEKFAELIVRECIDTVSDCSVEYCTRPQIVSEIKQHFGVES